MTPDRPSLRASVPVTWGELSDRQRQLVRLLADGLSYGAMAEVLGVTRNRARSLAFEVRRRTGLTNGRIVAWYLAPDPAVKRGHRAGCLCSVCYVRELERLGKRPPRIDRWAVRRTSHGRRAA